MGNQCRKSENKCIRQATQITCTVCDATGFARRRSDQMHIFKFTCMCMHAHTHMHFYGIRVAQQRRVLNIPRATGYYVSVSASLDLTTTNPVKVQHNRELTHTITHTRARQAQHTCARLRALHVYSCVADCDLPPPTPMITPKANARARSPIISHCLHFR